MKSKKILVGISLFGLMVGYAIAGQWSQYASCDTQYTKDTLSCNALPAATTTATKAKREACWSSATNRLATCNSSKGLTLNSPALNN